MKSFKSNFLEADIINVNMLKNKAFKGIHSRIKRRKARHTVIARILHWVYAPSMIALIFSGLYINNPTQRYGFKSMNSARKTHFIAQFGLLFSFIARVYYGIQSKNYNQIFPTRKTMKDLPGFLKYELMLTSKESKYPKYNPGQKILFTLFTLLTPIQVVSGFTLYMYLSFQKASEMVGGLNPLRKVHFLSALNLAIMATGHLYLAFTHGLKKLKSIFTGYE